MSWTIIEYRGEFNVMDFASKYAERVSRVTEAWQDAADWLRETANTLQELCNHIRANGYFDEEFNDDQD